MPPIRFVAVPRAQAVGKLQLPPMLQHPANVLEWAKTEPGPQLTVSTGSAYCISDPSCSKVADRTYRFRSGSHRAPEMWLDHRGLLFVPERCP